MHQLLWVRPFSGMRTAVIVAAMLVEQLELFSTTNYNRQSDVAAAYARWVRLRIRRANFLLCGHVSVAPLTDTALIARTHAMVQGW